MSLKIINKESKKTEAWRRKAYELLFHAEVHYQNKNSDYDKRISYVNFDNSIEISIRTYIDINIKPKGDQKEKKDDPDKYFHTKIKIFSEYIEKHKLSLPWPIETIVYHHKTRNAIYHNSINLSPNSADLEEIRKIAMWIFSVLFKIDIKFNITESENIFPIALLENSTISKLGRIENKHKNIFFSASILGEWNEKYPNDNHIIGQFPQNLRTWTDSIREIREYNNGAISLKNGHWAVNNKESILLEYALLFYDSHLDLIESIAINVLSEKNPEFDLKPDERFYAAIHGRTPKYSPELRKGLSETLVFLGMNHSSLTNCNRYKAEYIVTRTIRKLFQNADWKLWASLNDILPILAEAEPEQFLTSVENALKQSPCPFDELLKQKKDLLLNNNYMNGLYWALEILSWSEKYLTRAILILANLEKHNSDKNWGNSPSNSIITILLPWFPQTTASIDKRIASLKGIQNLSPKIAWHILLSLLPNQRNTSSDNQKPRFRKFIPDNWKKIALLNEYRRQVKESASMVIEMAKGNTEYVLQLIEKFNAIPEPAFNDFVKYLSSKEIVNFSDEQKLQIWENIIRFIKKNRQYSTEKWALSCEKVNLLEKIAGKLAPTDPIMLYRHLFSEKTFFYPEKDVDGETHEKNIQSQRTEALTKIYTVSKMNSIIDFANKVDQPVAVGYSFAQIANEKDNKQLFPVFLDCPKPFKKEFITGYVFGCYRKNKNTWFEKLNITDWSKKQICNILLLLPFENEIWGKVDELLGENAIDYWKKIEANPFSIKSNLLPAIKKLLKYNRSNFAFACVYGHYRSKKKLLKGYAIKSLLKGVLPNQSTNAYQITEIIKKLQNDPETNANELSKIEWIYMPLLKNNGANPELLEKWLSEEPDFFIKIIKTAYCLKKKNIKETDKEKLDADRGWQLLNIWQRPPGKLDDGSFSAEALKNWYAEVESKTKKSDYCEIAMEKFGHVLFYSESDPNGLWIQQEVAEMLDEKHISIREGFTSEVYIVDPSGEPEKELVKLWEKRADEVEAKGLIQFATSLRQIAERYEREADKNKLYFPQK